MRGSFVFGLVPRKAEDDDEHELSFLRSAQGGIGAFLTARAANLHVLGLLPNQRLYPADCNVALEIEFRGQSALRALR